MHAEYVYLYMLKYSLDFVFKDSVLAEMIQTEHVYLYMLK